MAEADAGRFLKADVDVETRFPTNWGDTFEARSKAKTAMVPFCWVGQVKRDPGQLLAFCGLWNGVREIQPRTMVTRNSTAWFRKAKVLPTQKNVRAYEKAQNILQRAKPLGTIGIRCLHAMRSLKLKTMFVHAGWNFFNQVLGLSPITGPSNGR